MRYGQPARSEAERRAAPQEEGESRPLAECSMPVPDRSRFALRAAVHHTRGRASMSGGCLRVESGVLRRSARRPRVLRLHVRPSATRRLRRHECAGAVRHSRLHRPEHGREPRNVRGCERECSIHRPRSRGVLHRARQRRASSRSPQRLGLCERALLER
jgi:hypothetical protein